MSYLQVADGSVSTQDECDGRDAQGYPRTARRRLRKNHDDAGTVTDIDTGQRFKVRKTKEGDRIVPLFDKRVQWKSASGYDALRLCLSCLGAPGEYVLWDEATGAEMTREEWCTRKFVSQSTPPIRHLCGKVVSTTRINNMAEGRVRPGCACSSSRMNPWSGRYAEFKKTLKDGYTLQLSEDEWKAQCTGKDWCPPIQCNKHGTTSTTTSVGSIKQGSIGCIECVPTLQLWSGRYSEFVALLPDGYTLQLSEDEWKIQCVSAHWCPPIRCNAHGITTSSTNVNTIQQGGSIDCPKCVSCHWVDRYAEFVALLPDWNTLQLSEEEWKEQCVSAHWCPPIRCNIHGITTNSTNINNIQQGGSIGCPKCFPLLARKTEAAVLKWLELAFPTATIAREVPGPGRTRFDFLLTFGNDHIVLEVDGPHHFWKNYFMYTESRPERDSEKARWALARGQWVVRVLADDVHNDRNGWRAWLRRAIDEARAGAAPRVLTPDAPEYRSPESAYIDPHANDTNA